MMEMIESVSESRGEEDGTVVDVTERNDRAPLRTERRPHPHGRPWSDELSLWRSGEAHGCSATAHRSSSEGAHAALRAHRNTQSQDQRRR